jgi:hypothetical protein
LKDRSPVPDCFLIEGHRSGQSRCHLDRKMDDLIRAAGFDLGNIETGYIARAESLEVSLLGLGDWSVVAWNSAVVILGVALPRC